MIQAVAISVILLSLTLSGCIFPDPAIQTNKMFFCLWIYADGPTELILPLPVFQPLFENISVRGGDCEYKVVGTPYGDGLWVRLDNFVRMTGRANERNDDWSTQMSINLTTMVPLKVDGAPQGAPHFWIQDREFWLNWSSGPLESILIDHSMVIGGPEFSYTTQLYTEDLEIGWNKIFVDGETHND